MDISRTVEPRSDQLNFDDVATTSLTMTVVEVRKGSAEQPVELHSNEYPGRPYKPGKSMRRVLIAAWGAEAAEYVGRRLTLYGDPTIRFGKDEVGGIRISHLSHLEKPLTVALTVTRGKRAPFTVQPLTEPDLPDVMYEDDYRALVEDWLQAFAEAGTLGQLQAAWEGAGKAGITSDQKVIAAKDKRKADLNA